ncbi:phosphopantetheine-binding protein [Aureibacter tunicatorum]|uniref:Acyl carrier protein n=1 Tax=Aureibacter tunicatorum TaxID=866807 RepID=A0AAE3XK75_9BACT|nr:phosphopantetheine-binding protein [Aureibacter tunicatorum]MDR6237503.1 acyl carrier protein [Aureibacter tunicatorum]BDD02537.1 hypothetical protein AUTU_00200 [Aureibacter tunicatorum]
MDSYFTKVKAMLVALGADEKIITMDSDIMNDLGLSSVDVVDLIYSVETAYDIKIPENSYAELNTVKALIEYIKDNVSPYLMEH